MQSSRDAAAVANEDISPSLTALPILAFRLHAGMSANGMVRLKPDLIIAATLAGAHAAQQASDRIPIVGINLTDPVGMGLVKSEARPGTNVTGSLVRLHGLTGKLLEIARDLLPSATTISVLVNVGNPSNVVQRQEAQASANHLSASLAFVEVRTAADLGPAFQAFMREGTPIVVVLQDSMFLNMRRQISAFALASRLPTVFGMREHVEDGGLISFYGVDLRRCLLRG
jgi:putative ABC transport system substrate-binding protein